MIITVGTCLILIAVWIVRFALPDYNKISEMEKEKQSLLGNLGREIKQSEIDNLKKDVSELDETINDKKERIYPVSELFELGEFFKRAGLNRDLKLVEIKPTYGQIKQLLVSTEGIISLPMTLEYVGPFSGITRYIDELDDFPYLFKIESYRLRIDEAGKSDLNFNIDIQMFFNNMQEIEKSNK